MLWLMVISFIFVTQLKRDGGDNNSGKGKSGEMRLHFLCCMTFIG